jgi:hypothetical protein
MKSFNLWDLNPINYTQSTQFTWIEINEQALSDIGEYTCPK